VLRSRVRDSRSYGPAIVAGQQAQGLPSFVEDFNM
jgi:hypothetical protein